MTISPGAGRWIRQGFDDEWLADTLEDGRFHVVCSCESKRTCRCSGARIIPPRICGGGMSGSKRKIVQSIQNGIERASHLYAREVLTDADVRPACECKVPCATALSEDVETIGIGEPRGIAICRAGHDIEHRSGGNAYSAKSHVFRSHSCLHEHWTIPAHRFFDRLRNETAILAQRLELIRILQQAREQHARAAIGRVTTRVHQLAKEGDHDLLRQSLAIHLSARQQADKVIPAFQCDGADPGRL